MSIHQIQIRHDPVEDRLLLRLATTDNTEVRFWMTRRYTRLLWKLIVGMLESDRAVRQQVDPATRREVLDIQHEGYAREADYTQQFAEPSAEAPRNLPLGAAPVLLGKAAAKKRDDGMQILSLQPMSGQGVDITMDARLLHVFSRLLQEQVAKTEWDLNLALHEGEPQAEPATAPVARKLN